MASAFLSTIVRLVLNNRSRSIVPFFSFRLFARRGEGRGGDAKRGEAKRRVPGVTRHGGARRYPHSLDPNSRASPARFFP